MSEFVPKHDKKVWNCREIQKKKSMKTEALKETSTFTDFPKTAVKKIVDNTVEYKKSTK